MRQVAIIAPDKPYILPEPLPEGLLRVRVSASRRAVGCPGTEADSGAGQGSLRRAGKGMPSPAHRDTAAGGAGAQTHNGAGQGWARRAWKGEHRHAHGGQEGGALLALDNGGPEGGLIVLRMGAGKTRARGDIVIRQMQGAEGAALRILPDAGWTGDMALNKVTVKPLSAPQKLLYSLGRFAQRARFKPMPYLRFLRTLMADPRSARLLLAGALLGDCPLTPERTGEDYAAWRALHEREDSPAGHSASETLFSALIACGPDEAADVERLIVYLNENQGARCRIIPFGPGRMHQDYAQALAAADTRYVIYMEAARGVPASGALGHMARAAKASAPDLIYGDDDMMAGGVRSAPRFLPEWNPELLFSQCYIAPMCALRRELAPEDCEGPHDFLMGAAEHAPRAVHIPRILFHAFRGAHAPDAHGAQTVARRLARMGRHARVDTGRHAYHIRYETQEQPLVSIIIPNRDQPQILTRCVRSLLDVTEYPNFEVMIIENSSRLPFTRAVYAELSRDARVRVLEWQHPYNFSAINNFAAQSARGEYLLLLNNDTEALAPDWLDIMMGAALQGALDGRPVGAVGARLIYPSGGLQHGGVVTGYMGVAGHPMQKCAPEGGYQGWADASRRVSAVTAACLMTPAKVYRGLGGMDEGLPVAFNDVDYCLRLGEQGYAVLYTPGATLKHHESLSRGDDRSEEGMRRHMKEVEDMWNRWGERLRAGDPCYSPWLSLHGEAYRIAPGRAGLGEWH